MEAIFSTSEEAAKCFASLSKLSRHLEKPVVITGGIAIGWHLLKKGFPIKKKPFNDIDTVVEDLSGIRSSLSQDFLINHFHPSRRNGKILIQLVDEEHGARIDVFTPNSKTLFERLSDFKIGNLYCKAVSAEDLAAKLLSIIYSVAKGEPINTKYVEHFRLLSTAVDLATAREVWHYYRQENQFAGFDEAAAVVERSLASNINLLQDDEYCQNINSACQWCGESKKFPLAPRTKIYEILGYV